MQSQVYGSHPECYDDGLNEYMLIDDNPFGFNELNYVRSVEESKRLNTSKQPMVIISSAGMMNAGRIRHHLYNNIEDEKCTFLIVGYCSPYTAGGMLRAGVPELKVFGDILQVNAEIKVMDSFSAHGDQNEMLDYISNQKAAKKVFLVHGEYDTQKAYKKFLEQHGFDDVLIPPEGEEYLIK